MQGVVHNIPDNREAQSEEYAVGPVLEANGRPHWEHDRATVMVGSGLAIIDTGEEHVGEIYYRARSRTALVVPRPKEGKRKDLVVLRANLWSRSIQVLYTEGGARAPKPEHSEQAIDLPLAELTVTAEGDISVKDLRTWYGDGMEKMDAEEAAAAGIEMVVD